MSKPDEANHPLNVYFPREGAASFRGPKGLKQAIDDFLTDVNVSADTTFSRNDFILSAIRHYLRYLTLARSQQDLLARMRERFEFIDSGDEENTLIPESVDPNEV